MTKMAEFRISPAPIIAERNAMAVGIVSIRPYSPNARTLDWYLTDDINPEDQPFILVKMKIIGGMEWVISDGYNYWRVKKGLSFNPSLPSVDVTDHNNSKQSCNFSGMRNPKCPSCRTVTERCLITYRTNKLRDGAHTTVTATDVPVWKCGQCGYELFDYASEDRINEVFRDQIGLLQPDEIRRRRNAAGLSLDDAARITGIQKERIENFESRLLIQSSQEDSQLRTI